ncbi:hypothetical protein [Emticicia sp. TH156]|uniref:hypothetical protein n=1 Tax=Emticicia sp. TH156 TaxID=2067454 RepID=UPI000C77C797|nr:hypothetical protein [Emticicia sp. TH156]PLK44495.1 hypothetical protein C0V77_11980 [Emticicia sp. TH156]
MTNNEALTIAANYDVILEMTGIDFGYSLELLEESKKVKPVQDSLENVQSLLTKKLKPLHEKKKNADTAPEEQAALDAEIKAETEKAHAEWNRITEAAFAGSFRPVELSKIPTDTERLDKRLNKDGISMVRAALLLLSRKGLVKK